MPSNDTLCERVQTIEGHQIETRTCIDGTMEKCSVEDTLKMVYCNITCPCKLPDCKCLLLTFTNRLLHRNKIFLLRNYSITFYR